MVRNLTPQEHQLINKLIRSNTYWRLSGIQLQVANQLSFEEMVERHPTEEDAFAYTWKGMASLNLPIEEDPETDSI